MENTLFLILLKMFFKIEIFEKHTLFIGGGGGNRTRVQKPSHMKRLQFIL